MTLAAGVMVEALQELGCNAEYEMDKDDAMSLWISVPSDDKGTIHSHSFDRLFWAYNAERPFTSFFHLPQEQVGRYTHLLCQLII